jgi:hypothetical protein
MLLGLLMEGAGLLAAHPLTVEDEKKKEEMGGKRV